MKKVLVTGAAGFIGYHLVTKLLADGYSVVGLDNINDYYSPDLKYGRLEQLGVFQSQVKWFTLATSSTHEDFRFVRMNIEDKQQLFALFHEEQFDFIVNLAAQAGVRYSIDNPDVYIQSNIVGFHFILEACKTYNVKHLVHASSSSVYGSNAKVPFSEDDRTETPVSLYAATKKSNELMAHCYSHLYDIPITCLRFFTVYGPWGRPDMAPMLFASAIAKGESIKIFNNGEMERDFTFVGDIVNGIAQTMTVIPDGSPKYRMLNIGNGDPVNLMEFISVLEKYLKIDAVKSYLPMQAGDVVRTWADQSKFVSKIGFKPEVKLETGISAFVEWFAKYYKLEEIQS